MKILIIGSLSNYAIERYFNKYLNNRTHLDVECKVFVAQDLFLDYYNKSLANKIIFRLGHEAIYKSINIKLKNFIEDYQPDIIWVFKGMEVFPETLKWAKEKHIKLINFNPDNPFIFTGSGSGNSNVSRSIGLYDIHFTYNHNTKKELEKKYKIPTFWLPFGYDISEVQYQDALRENEILKTCFIGTPDFTRVEFLKEIAKSGIKVDLFGNHWKNHVNHKNFTIHPAVYGNELLAHLHKYRIQLNPLRIHNVDSHGMRSFEVPGIGGLMLAPRTTEHVKFFEEGKESFFYSTTHEAISRINEILALTSEETTMLRKNARQRCITSGYSYENRTEEVLTILNTV